MDTRRRGVTLIEAVLFISVALGLIVGGLVFYQQASLAARTQEAVRQFSAIIAETRALFKGRAFETQVANNSNALAPSSEITATLIAAQAVPPNTVSSPTTLRNPWGGTTRVFGGRVDPWSTVIIIADGIPLEACSRLIAASVTDPEGAVNTGTEGVTRSNQIGDGLILTGTGSSAGWSFWFRTYSPAQAGIVCRYGASALAFRDAPSVSAGTPELSGGRTVIMGFTLY